VDGLAERLRRQVLQQVGHVGGVEVLDGPAQREARSHTNVVFRLSSSELDDRFLAGARENGLVNLKGHRSVGGFRASIYNAMPDEGVAELAEYMRDFARSTG